MKYYDYIALYHAARNPEYAEVEAGIAQDWYATAEPVRGRYDLTQCPRIAGLALDAETPRKRAKLMSETEENVLVSIVYYTETKRHKKQRTMFFYDCGTQSAIDQVRAHGYVPHRVDAVNGSRYRGTDLVSIPMLAKRTTVWQESEQNQ